ncbi:MAG TPA: CHASE2 domain-containing protein [Verrucomicrobiae bacterium]|nr:CHASE2 domain-containing protein [Verrucomicrobiae bacterium]
MKGRAIRQNPSLVSALGAVLAVLCGWLLWGTPVGDPWTDASYDYLFRFSSRAVTNQVTLIQMDDGAFGQFHQTRGQPWDRALHARLMNRLADDGCPLVVFDSFFQLPRDPDKDAALAAAMRRQKDMILMAKQSEVSVASLEAAEALLPADMFLEAVGTNHWGVAWFHDDPDHIVRRQWPFPSPGPYPSLPWSAAQQAGAKLSNEPQERWLRYYGQKGAWTRLSYQFALAQPTNYFRNQIVFIGTEPETSVPEVDKTDKFSTPYTRWTDEASGGVELNLTAFLNLLNNDSLKRPVWWVEFLVFLASGILLGAGLCRLKLVPALALAAGIVLLVAPLAISLSHFTNYWFPWLVIVGGQVPCALAWAWAMNVRPAVDTSKTAIMEPLPETPGFELVQPAFGGGAYGKVWLAKNPAGQWRALKAVYLSKFENNPEPYEREFNGVKTYKPISDQHPGLLRVDFVSEKLAGYFYYTMELGDALEPGWEKNPSAYKPRDLFSERARLPEKRLPVKECLRIGLALSKALEFIHGRGMAHRDIKPQNVIFINGDPKLADMGLVTEIRPDDQERTIVGTHGFMPPPPERPGTPQADIYGLGMVLYVISTGRSATVFPEVSTTLIASQEPVNYMPLNAVILKACQPDMKSRYTSASELSAALQKVMASFGGKA